MERRSQVFGKKKHDYDNKKRQENQKEVRNKRNYANCASCDHCRINYLGDNKY